MAKTKTGDSRKAVYILMESSQTNKYYVGSSMDLITRFKSYNRKQRGNRIIDNSLNKYGFDSFYKYVVNFEDSIEESDLRLWEGFYIRLFGSYHYENEDGMNLVKNPNTAPSMDENVKKKISNKCKGIKKEWLSIRNKDNKFGLGRKGSLSAVSKKVLCLKNNIIFESITEASKFYNISRPGMAYKIKNNENLFKLI